jgi:hypothetical protein
MSRLLLEPAAVEKAPIEAMPARAVVEIRPPDKITAIAQLPSIWTLEQPIEWLIDGIIPLGSVNLITSESGTGKTWVAYAIAGAVARGEGFAGHAVKQRPVLYLDGENPLCVAKQRLFDLGIPETNGLQVWGGWWPRTLSCFADLSCNTTPGTRPVDPIPGSYPVCISHGVLPVPRGVLFRVWMRLNCKFVRASRRSPPQPRRDYPLARSGDL